MLPKRLFALIAALGLAAALIVVVAQWTLGGRTLPARQAAAAPMFAQTAPDGIREVASPDISFIQSDSATCSRSRPGSGICTIEWNNLYVTAASGSYIISMTVSINNQMRAYHGGFFQNNIYIPASMTGHGYRVTCGYPQGNAGLGNAYSYTIRARETSGLTAANYGSVTCPADIVKIYLPAVLKP